MARSVTEIHKGLLDKVAADETLSTQLTSTSTTAIYRLILYIVAFCAYAVENIFDFLKIEVNNAIDLSRSHPPRWYVEMSKKFQYGYDLVEGKDYYDNTDVTPEEIAESKIISYASLVEEPTLRLKVATVVDGKLSKVPDDKMIPFREYVRRFRDAGVKLRIGTDTVPTNITSSDPDLLKLKARIKFNPLVLKDNGSRVDGTAVAPVNDSIDTYLQNIDFDGVFSVQKLEKEMLAVSGVTDLKIDSIQTKYGDLPFTSVDIEATPDSGYFKILPEDIELIFEPE